MKYLLIICALLIAPLQAFAIDAGSAFQDVSKLNRIPPLQNPQYQKAEDMISRTINSEKNRVIGQTRDVIVNADGEVTALYVDLKDRGFKQTTYLNVEDLGIRFLSNGYGLNFERDQIADILPQILASTSTASGDTAEEIGVSHIIGQIVRDEKGRSLGKVNTVLFNKKGRIAEAIAIQISKNTVIALPFGSIKITPPASSRASAKLTVTQEYATAARSFLKENK